MSDFLEPFWDFLFDEFGVLGILIASFIPILLTVLVIALVVAVVNLFRKPKASAVKPSKTPAVEKTVVPKHATTPAQMYQKAEALIRESFDNIPEAIRLYTDAAKQGYRPAQCTVGRMYYYGVGSLRPNKKEGIYWLTKAAEAGYTHAQFLLGRIYLETKDVADLDNALRWLTPAAEQDHADAQYLLSRAYDRKLMARKKDKGYTGTEWHDDATCMEYYRANKHWLKQAVNNGSEEARDLYY